MKDKTKVVLIGTAFGIVPVLIALIPFTILWWYFNVRTGGTWISFDYIQNLKWLPIWIVCYMVTWKGLNLAAGYYLDAYVES